MRNKINTWAAGPFACFVLSFLISFAASTVFPESGVTPSIGDYEAKYNLSKLTFEYLNEDEKIRKDLYLLRAKEKLTIENKDVALFLYSVKNEVLLNYDNIPHSYVEIRSNNKVRRIGLLQDQPAKELSYNIPKTKIPTLAVEDTTGGNCSNCQIFHIVTLDKQHFLDNIGTVTGIIDIEKSGVEEFFVPSVSI